MQNYINNSVIEYSNRVKLIIHKNLFTDYIKTLSNEKIMVDVIRLNYTKDFIKKFEGHIRNISNIQTINTNNVNFIKEDEIQYFHYSQIKNKPTFDENFIKMEPFMKYFLHQDIHNSVIHPILISIMLSNMDNTNTFTNNIDSCSNKIIQFRDIKQIYLNWTDDNHIEVLYFIKNFFTIDIENMQSAQEYKIKPFLIIKCDFIIKADFVETFITF